MVKAWFEEIFSNTSKAYDKEPFVAGAAREVDFIEQEIEYNKETRILDIGCGTGRHAIELARRGYRVVGVDISATQIDSAKKKASLASVKPEFFVGDARELAYLEEFELALIICEGGFGLMENDSEDFKILEGAARALRPGGKLILTALSALYALAHPPGLGRFFDPLTFRETFEVEGVDDDGQKKKLNCSERLYAPSEIVWRLDRLGFEEVAVCGCDLGAFSRDRVLTSDDLEMLVLASLSHR